jgi:hypothetical protein
VSLVASMLLSLAPLVPGDTTLTLAQAMRLAQQRGTQAALARTNAAIAGERVGERRADLLPNINGFAGWQRSTQNIDEFGLPGMVVMHWAFGGGKNNPHRLANHRENQVVYTATHDNDTTVGWFRSLPKAQQVLTGLDPRRPSWALIDLAWSSRAAAAITPVQDVLGLGSEARMNRPGTEDGNWRWRLRRGQLTERHATRLRAVTEASGR